jgi:hypothetical protein
VEKSPDFITRICNKVIMQRFADRGEAGNLLDEGEICDLRRKDEKMVDAVAGHGYT